MTGSAEGRGASDSPTRGGLGPSPGRAPSRTTRSDDAGASVVPAQPAMGSVVGAAALTAAARSSPASEGTTRPTTRTSVAR